MKAKKCGAMATVAGVALTWLCLASGDGGLGAKDLGARDYDPGIFEAGAGQRSTPTRPQGEADFKTWLPRALSGDPHAAFRLGRAYAEGESRIEDFGEAARWFRLAAQAGHGPAQADLAMLYGKGLGVPQDYVWSYAWFAAAAENMAHGRARDQTIELRDMMAAFLSPEDRARAERLAAELTALSEK